jgi:hypothetical protein
MSTGKAFAVNLAPTFAPTPSLSLAPALHAAGHAAIAAAPFVAAAAAAAGAVFLTRAALRGLGVASDKFDADAKERRENRTAAMAWEDVFAEVYIRNSRITRLRKLAATTKGTPAVLTPFVYSGQSLADLTTWCTDTDRSLQQAEKQLSDARIRAVLEQPASAPVRVVYERVKRSLVDYGPSAPSAPPAPPTPTGPAADPVRDTRPIDLQPLVDAILTGAAGSVSGDDLAALAAQAAEVLARQQPAAAKAHLDQLHLLATEARLRQERRTADSEAAAKWLIALAPLAEEPGKMSAYQRAMLARLEDVVAEREALDDNLREAAEGLARVATRAAADRAISTAFAQELALKGYAVTVTHGDSETPEHLCVSRTEWDGGHADVDIHAGDLEATFQAEGATGRVDLHVSDWAKDVGEVKRRTAETGVRSGKLVMVGHPDLAEPRLDAVADSDADSSTTTSPKPLERPTPNDSH